MGVGTKASGPRTVAAYDPGADAAERYPAWVIRHRAIGVPEIIDLDRRVILLDRTQSYAAKRSSLAHAVAHLDCGHVVVGGHLGQRQEFEAEMLAALRLITIPSLADAIRWHGQRWARVADSLGVDERLLRVRMDHLHPRHRTQLTVELRDHLEGMPA